MPRPRSRDPLNLPSEPNLAKTPEREQELTDEFLRRIAYVLQSYTLFREAHGPIGTFNEDLRLLKNSLSKTAKRLPARKRIHPELELLINFHARNHARTRTGSDHPTLTQEDIDEGARKTLETVNPRRGRPEDLGLRYHVEALMALCQETCGLPAMAQAERDNVYDPQATNLTGETVIRLARHIEPSATTTQIVGIMRAARRRYAGKPMRFLDFFPAYGGKIDSETAELTLRPGWKVEHFEASHPIYCR